MNFLQAVCSIEDARKIGQTAFSFDLPEVLLSQQPVVVC